MMGRLDGKVAVVTAAAQGIGRATCETFAREGATVYALDINVEKLKELEACTGDIRTRRVDVTSKEEIEKFTEDVPSVDILFNCAGYVFMGTLLETEERDWDFSFDLNIKSMFLLTKAVLPKMLKQKSGSIINIASVASTIKALPNECVYATTKAAVIGFTKSTAVDYVKDGIRANSICPGSIETPSLQMRMSEIEDGRNKFMSRQPSGRLGKPQEVANVALFLASDEASFVSGSEYKVDNCWSA